MLSAQIPEWICNPYDVLEGCDKKWLHTLLRTSGFLVVKRQVWMRRANIAFRLDKNTFFFPEIWDCKCVFTPELSRKKRVLRGS